jgi:hypothetical protein
MTTFATSGGMSLIELANRSANQKLLRIINTLSATNQIMQFAQWTECNNGRTYVGTRRSTRITGTWRDYDEGVAGGVTTTAPYEEPTSTLAHTFVIDKDRKADAPDPMKFVNDEIEMEMRDLQIQAMTAFFYGDRATDSSFAGKMVNGLSNRTDWNTLSSSYVYDNAGGSASATANKTSLWVLSFGPNKLELCYPRGSAPGGQEPAEPDAQGWGIKMKLLNKDTGEDTSGNIFPADNIWFQQRWGLVAHDPRYIARVPNISTTNIDEVDDFSFNEDYVIDAISAIPMLHRAGTVVCGNAIMEAQIWKAVKNSGSRMFTEGVDAFGNRVPAICGLPYVRCDAIVSTEATVS